VTFALVRTLSRIKIVVDKTRYRTDVVDVQHSNRNSIGWLRIPGESILKPLRKGCEVDLVISLRR